MIKVGDQVVYKRDALTVTLGLSQADAMGDLVGRVVSSGYDWLKVQFILPENIFRILNRYWMGENYRNEEGKIVVVWKLSKRNFDPFIPKQRSPEYHELKNKKNRSPVEEYILSELE